MKVTSVRANNRKRLFEVTAGRRVFTFPYSRCEPPPTRSDPIVRLFVDPELGREGFTYVLRSGAEGEVLMDQVLDANRDPAYLRKMLLHKLTVEALKGVERSPLSKREIVRRLGSSATQLYRLLDSTNSTKSVDQMVRLLQVLGCDVDVVVKEGSA